MSGWWIGPVGAYVMWLLIAAAVNECAMRRKR